MTPKNQPSRRFRSQRRFRRREQGFVLIVMGAAAFALMGAVGLAVDMGRIFIVKNETQAFCDSAAMAAALQLDGTSTGITNATNAVTSTTSNFYFGANNKWNFDTTTVASPTVQFGASASGPWYADASGLSGAGVALDTVSYAQVSSSVSANLYFMPVVMLTNGGTSRNTTTVTAAAVAGQVAVSSTSSMSVGLVPFSAVASSSTGPNYGLTPGGSYDIQWPQYNGNRKNCGKSNGNVQNCFVSPPCTDESTTSEQEVVTYWGSSINGYWGSNSASVINGQILDTKQLNSVYIGEDLQPILTSGNKATTQKTLDDRVNSDPANYETTYSAYIADTSHNGRRLIAVPVVLPQAGTGSNSESIVMTYATFLLQTNASSGGSSTYYQSGTGNDPDCAVYVGPYNIGSMNGGVTSSSTMATHVRLVQ